MHNGLLKETDTLTPLITALVLSVVASPGVGQFFSSPSELSARVTCTRRAPLILWAGLSLRPQYVMVSGACVSCLSEASEVLAPEQERDAERTEVKS